MPPRRASLSLSSRGRHPCRPAVYLPTNRSDAARSSSSSSFEKNCSESSYLSLEVQFLRRYQHAFLPFKKAGGALSDLFPVSWHRIGQSGIQTLGAIFGYCSGVRNAVSMSGGI